LILVHNLIRIVHDLDTIGLLVRLTSFSLDGKQCSAVLAGQF
jgi:hypothetical protein